MAERKGEYQKLKMLYLVKIFSEETDDEHSLTMPEIVSKLAAYGVNADRKTLYRDFALLKEYGLDIISEQDGRNYLYHLGSREFELPELKLLVDSVQSARFITDRKSDELIRKLEGLASKYQGKQLHRQVTIAGRAKTMNENIYYNVDEIHAAIDQDKQIRFRYYNWDLNKELKANFHGMWYQLSPWALMWDDEMYYMVAYDSKYKVITHYRVDKMKDIGIVDSKREGQEAFRSFDLAHYAKSMFGMFGGKETKVTVEGENYMVGVLIDRFGKDLIIAPISDTRFRTTITVAVSTHFLGWMMSLGKDISIVAPEPVVERMRQEIVRLSEQYNV